MILNETARILGMNKCVLIRKQFSQIWLRFKFACVYFVNENWYIKSKENKFKETLMTKKKSQGSIKVSLQHFHFQFRSFGIPLGIFLNFL
jgi:hypothetical protein